MACVDKQCSPFADMAADECGIFVVGAIAHGRCKMREHHGAVGAYHIAAVDDIAAVGSVEASRTVLEIQIGRIILARC